MTLGPVFLLLELFAAADPLAEAAAKYFERCEAAKAAGVRAKEEQIKALEAEKNPTPEGKAKLQAAKIELKRLADLPAPNVPLPLPPMKGDMGVFGPAKAEDSRRGKSVDVLEIVDEDEAIVRAWYVPPANGNDAIREEATFVDLWIQGIDTAGMTAKSPASLPQVFHVSGSKLFDTTCGKRSLPLLVPVDIEHYRNGGK